MSDTRYKKVCLAAPDRASVSAWRLTRATTGVHNRTCCLVLKRVNHPGSARFVSRQSHLFICRVRQSLHGSAHDWSASSAGWEIGKQIRWIALILIGASYHGRVSYSASDITIQVDVPSENRSPRLFRGQDASLHRNIGA